MRHFWYLLLDCLHATAVMCASGLSGGSKATSSGEQDTLCRIALTLGCLLCVHRLSHLLTVSSRCLPGSAEMSSDLRSSATCPEAGKLGDVAEPCGSLSCVWMRLVLCSILPYSPFFQTQFQMQRSSKGSVGESVAR